MSELIEEYALQVKAQLKALDVRLLAALSALGLGVTLICVGISYILCAGSRARDDLSRKVKLMGRIVLRSDRPLGLRSISSSHRIYSRTVAPGTRGSLVGLQTDSLNPDAVTVVSVNEATGCYLVRLADGAYLEIKPIHFRAGGESEGDSSRSRE